MKDLNENRRIVFYFLILNLNSGERKSLPGVSEGERKQLSITHGLDPAGYEESGVVRCQNKLFKKWFKSHYNHKS